MQRLRDIVENADAIASYIDGMSYATFVADRRTIDATERCIERAIEASIRIGPEQMAKVLSSFPAAEMRGMGNRLRHEYGTINVKTVWLTAVNDIPALAGACAAMLTKFGNA